MAEYMVRYLAAIFIIFIVGMLLAPWVELVGGHLDGAFQHYCVAVLETVC